MPVVFRVQGYRFFFYSNQGDPREPRHIHVRQGRDEAKFRLHPTISIAYSAGFDARSLNRIQRPVEEHRDELDKAWNDYFG